MEVAARRRGKIFFVLDVRDGWPPVAVETLWVSQVGGDTYEVENIPFFAKDVALGDLVAGRLREDRTLEFVGVVQRGGHSTLRVICLEQEHVNRVAGKLHDVGCAIERSPFPRMFAIDVPSATFVPAAHRILKALRGRGVLEYEDAYLARD